MNAGQGTACGALTAPEVMLRSPAFDVQPSWRGFLVKEIIYYLPRSLCSLGQVKPRMTPGSEDQFGGVDSALRICSIRWTENFD